MLISNVSAGTSNDLSNILDNINFGNSQSNLSLGISSLNNSVSTSDSLGSSLSTLDGFGNGPPKGTFDDSSVNNADLMAEV